MKRHYEKPTLVAAGTFRKVTGKGNATQGDWASSRSKASS
ncbi:keywimysin-related RiPP [Streptomyces hiroshimensis]